jgi:hypothetical protein
LPLEASKEFLVEINLLRFHYTWLNGINSTEIEALWEMSTYIDRWSEKDKNLST